MILEREKKKKALKERVVVFDESVFKEQNNRKPIKNRKQKITIFVIVISFVFILVLFLLFVRKYNVKNTLFTKSIASTDSSYTVNTASYESFQDGLIRYSKDGASYIDKNGSIRWSTTYNINNPFIETKGEYVLIADSNGVDAFLFTKIGKLIDIISDDLIQKISLSNNGDIAILTRNEDESFVNLYDHTGKNGDIYIKYVKEEDGEPLDISLSFDGKILMVSLCKIEEKNINSYIEFYNFDKNAIMDNDNRLIDTIDQYYKDKIAIKTEFLNGENAVTFYDGGFTFFDIKDNKISTKNIIEDKIIHSIYIEKENVYTVIENDSKKKNMYTLKRYNKKGSVKLKKEFNEDFLTFYVTNGQPVFIGLDEVLILDNFGITRYNGKLFDNFIYLKSMYNLGFMDTLIGLENSVKRMILY